MILTGCDDVLTTIKLEPVQEDRILGAWSEPDSPDTFDIERHENGYRIASHDPNGSGDPIDFTLARAGDTLFMQFRETCANHVFSYDGDTRTCYKLSRVELGTNEFTVYSVGLEGFLKQSSKGAVKVDHKISRSVSKDGTNTTCVLIEGTARDLSAWLAAYPKEAYDDPARVVRAK
jgi:hypothetical protein